MTTTKTVTANEPRSTGPAWDTYPASLPQIAYVTADGGFLCVTCANGGHGSRATDTLDPNCRKDNQWRIIGAQTNDGAIPCDHCGRSIEPAPQS